MKRCGSNSSLPSSSSSVSSSSSSSIVVDQEDIIIDSLHLLHNQPTPHPPPNNSKRSSPNHKKKRVRIGKRTGIDDGEGGRNNGSKRQRKPNDSNAAAFSAVVPTIDAPADAANPTTTTITNAGNRKGGGGGGRSSVYRGVTRHRWTGRFEAHLWDKACWNSVQNKKGRQVYLGAYDSEEDAARTYDLAALKYWGPDTTLNFPLENYGKEVDEMQNVSREEYLASLRRRSSGFSRGVSKYRGVARHHHNGRWEARIGRVLGNKYLYLGTFSSQEEAAIAYDLAAIEYRGANAVTNFDISNYFGHAGKKNHASIDQIRQQQNLNNPSNNIESNPSQHQHPSTPLLSPSSPSSPPNTLTHRLEQLPDSTTPATPPPHQTHTESYLLDNSLDVGPKQEPDDQIWNFCSENIDFDFDVDSYLVPHIPLDEDGNMLDLFGDTVFQDNIDLVFQGETTSPSNLNDQLDGLIQQVNIDVFADGIAGTSDISCSTASKDVEEQKMDNFACFSSLSPLSASSSTTTSSMLCQL